MQGFSLRSPGRRACGPRPDKRCNSPETFGGSTEPSGVCSVARRSAALRRVGLKLRMPSRARVPFIRLTMRVRSLTRHSRSRLGRLQMGLRRLGTKSSQTLRWREMDSNFRFRVRCKRGLRRKSPASAACGRRFCGCRRRWPSAQAQSEISGPNPYRARNRKFESISLQRRVRDEPMSGLWHPDRRDLLAPVVSAVADG
jgi:hypothetical protein